MAFERFLARLFIDETETWVLKGGYVLELRFPNRARSTRDLDLNVPPLLPNLLQALQLAARYDLGDYFEFRVSVPASRAELPGPPLGGYRFNVEARLAGRKFIGFPVDVGQGDVTVSEPQVATGKVDLSFAGIPVPIFAVYPVEDHFAEKLHAYTAPREFRTRVKDLVDMVLFIEEGLQRTEVLEKAINATFARYQRHVRPDVLPRPPAEWQAGFERMARQVQLSVVSIDDAFELLSQFLTGTPPTFD